MSTNANSVDVGSVRERPSVEGKSARLDDLADSVRLLHQVSAELDRFTKMRDDLQAAIKDQLGDAEIGTVDGRPVVTWKGTWRLGVSQSQLKQRYPVIAADVCETSWVRRFRLLDP